MQEVADEIVFANVDPLKSPRNWTLRKLLDEFVDIGGNCLAEQFGRNQGGLHSVIP
ncbi:hypothetical protein DsansV1_C19g0157311 [Dioscorea sansibarensis]